MKIRVRLQVNKPLESGESEVSQGILRSDFGDPVFYDWFIQVQHVAAVEPIMLVLPCSGEASGDKLAYSRAIVRDLV
ncbi:hypothetical protein [Thalassoglobus sp.]|uniref:hypothetical protein n=1 Tax=Thalassoglobus sp. TaxID=2795869 RepID=UPI003AA83150